MKAKLLQTLIGLVNINDSLDDTNESSGSQFLRTTNGIESGTDPFDESRLVFKPTWELEKYYAVPD